MYFTFKLKILNIYPIKASNLTNCKKYQTNTFFKPLAVIFV